MSKITVDGDTYTTALDTLTSAARSFFALADLFDLDHMRTRCAEYQTIAPLLQPTAYQQGGSRNLDDQAAFLTAVHRFVDDLRKLASTAVLPPSSTIEELNRG
jgi:flagellar biosynthesis/type III secretory pathway ATPase